MPAAFGTIGRRHTIFGFGSTERSMQTLSFAGFESLAFCTVAQFVITRRDGAIALKVTKSKLIWPGANGWLLVQVVELGPVVCPVAQTHPDVPPDT